MITLTSPVTGGLQTGFTAPTYTLTQDTSVSTNGKAYAVTTLGGTQVGVSVHAAALPFTWAYFKPLVYRMLGRANTSTGIISTVPTNTHKIRVRKGVIPAANQVPAIMTINIDIGVPANAELYDAPNVLAAISLAQGTLTQLAASIGDTIKSNLT